jgi:hypothetical protein
MTGALILIASLLLKRAEKLKHGLEITDFDTPQKDQAFWRY